MSRDVVLTVRQREAYDLRKQGKTFVQVGEAMGIGKQRARDLYMIARVRSDRDPHWMDGLSVRAGNCLNNFGLKSREEAKEAFSSGKLKPGELRCYGWKTHVEVAKWLGVIVPQKISAAERFTGVREDLLRGWYSDKEICLRRGVSSATVWRIKKGTIAGKESHD